MTSGRSTKRSARSSEPLSRSRLGRALAVNALTTPLNVLVPAGMVVAGMLIGTSWLLVAAVVLWLALVATTFFDERVARRVGERVRAERGAAAPAAGTGVGALAPAISGRVRAATASRDAIRAAIARSDSPLVDVTAEVDALVTAVEGNAVRAQRIHEFLAAEPPGELERRIAEEPSDAVRAALHAKLDAMTRLRRRLDQMLSELDHVIITLQTLQAEILAGDGTEGGLLAGQVSELRTNVRLISEGLEEAFAETRAHVVH
jgi:hypothetical protein